MVLLQLAYCSHCLLLWVSLNHLPFGLADSFLCHSLKAQIAGSPSNNGTVIRKLWLQFYIQFISLLVAYSP